MTKRARDKQVLVRLSDLEYSLLVNLANEAELSLAEYLRQLLMIESRKQDND